MDEEGSWYRVVDRSTSGAGPFWHIRLRPEGWTGRDLMILVFRGCEEPWSLGSLHSITPEQRARWRAAGTLV